MPNSINLPWKFRSKPLGVGNEGAFQISAVKFSHFDVPASTGRRHSSQPSASSDLCQYIMMFANQSNFASNSKNALKVDRKTYLNQFQFHDICAAWHHDLYAIHLSPKFQAIITIIIKLFK